MLDEVLLRGTRLCVVGSVCRDVKTAPLAAGDYLLRDGETPTGFISEAIGGGAANSALLAAGLGAQVSLAGKLGADALGDRLETALRQRGVQPFLCRDAAVQTGSTVVLSFANGSRHFVSCQPNNYALAFANLDLAMLTDTDHLLRADVWFSEPMLADGNAQLCQAALARGLTTSLDLNWDPLWGSGDAARIATRKAAVRKILPLVNLVHGNIPELNRFADSTDLSTTLQRLLMWGAEAVVIHMGAEGAGFFSGGKLVVEPCAPAEKIVNTAGTGDLLSVCMILLHRHRDLPVAEKLRLANRIVADFIAGRRNLLPPLDAAPTRGG